MNCYHMQICSTCCHSVSSCNDNDALYVNQWREIMIYCHGSQQLLSINIFMGVAIKSSRRWLPLDQIGNFARAYRHCTAPVILQVLLLPVICRVTAPWRGIKLLRPPQLACKFQKGSRTTGVVGGCVCLDNRTLRDHLKCMFWVCSKFQQGQDTPMYIT